MMPTITCSIERIYCNICEDCSTGKIVVKEQDELIKNELGSGNVPLLRGCHVTLPAFPTKCEYPADGIMCPCVTSIIIIHDYDDLVGYT